MTSDKRDECGCHKGCLIIPHECTDKPCVWPSCLSELESEQLGIECERSILDLPPMCCALEKLGGQPCALPPIHEGYPHDDGCGTQW